MSTRGKRQSSRNQTTVPSVPPPTSSSSSSSSQITKSVVDTSSSSSKSNKLDIDTFFNQYFKPTEDENTVATMEGICHFAETFFKIDPMVDIRILVFLWKMIEGGPQLSFTFPSPAASSLKKSSSTNSNSSSNNRTVSSSSSTTTTTTTARRPSSTGGGGGSIVVEDKSFRPGHFTKEQFQKGCIKRNVDTEASLYLLLPTLDTGFLEKMDFRNFFKFCFQFNRQGTNRFLEKDLVIGLIPLLLKDRVPSHRIQSFCDFLTVSKDVSYDKITLDQWISFFDFCMEYPNDDDDVIHFDSDGSAWPTLIDDYVEFCVEKGYK